MNIQDENISELHTEDYFDKVSKYYIYYLIIFKIPVQYNYKPPREVKHEIFSNKQKKECLHLLYKIILTVMPSKTGVYFKLEQYYHATKW